MDQKLRLTLHYYFLSGTHAIIGTLSSLNKSACVLVAIQGDLPHGGCIELCLLNVKLLPLMLLGTGTPDHTHITNHNVVDW